ncbi:hypothetical protein ACJJTC_011040 [Scirpophaga incertulas]
MESTVKAKSKPVSKEEHVQELAAKLEETDEIKFKLLATMGKPDSDDILYPSELNAHLIEQLKVMTCENNELRKCVFTKDSEIKELNKTVADMKQRIRDIISGTGPAISSKSAGIISAKITELCKQNRHLVSEVESYKTKNAALERKIMQLDIINKENEKTDLCLCKEEPEEATSDELKDLNTKLNSVNKKLYESKNKNLELKNDILIATKILQQELGDKFTSIKELQNDLAGWKGRAQQIILLQARISELEEKLNGKHKDLFEAKRKDQTQIIKEIEVKRKKEIDLALKDLNNLKEENRELRKKLDGARCRIRNLECDTTTVRQKIQTFVEKSNHDDLLINEQRTQIKNIEIYYQDILRENSGKMTKLNVELAEQKKLVDNADSKIDALRRQATEKTAKIDELRTQLLRYEECSLQSVFFTPMKTATDNEIRKLSELVVTLNNRLDAERHKWEELDVANRKLRERKKRLEKKLLIIDDELKKTRETRRGSRSSKISIKEQQNEPAGFVSAAKKQSSIAIIAEKPSESSTESPAVDYDSLDKDELKYKLELSEEKLKVMEDKLKMVEEEKQEDYSHLTKMIQTSKQLFHEALSVLQKEKCICSSP